ncbi:hypothetical protein AJ80_07144 [Polytolypa hystricis UAMH7299]|uniref:mRNA-capping enzyme subunit beta n=1 Tax=Polytolypa hystricis (strain UAMH7299) TaxID=1447883 RepID=A0A2B7XHZ9_POLH7|nr:hypothetical protein AJ80_07144 [Polytolypa hystricis UAMH7299]
MDLRTIINTDAAASGPTKPPSQQQQPPPSPLQHSHLAPPNPEQQQPHRALSPASYQQAHPDPRSRPPQPPPLQPPLHSPSGSSSYGSAQSPYQHSSASTLSAGPHSQINPALPHGLQTYQQPVAPRDSYGPNSAAPSQNPPSGQLASPYTPQTLSAGTAQSYFSQQRSHSIHSVPTPSSAHSYSYPPRDGPGAPQQPGPSQSQPFSPHQSRSHPGTPLGPPSATYPRPSPHPPRPPSSGRDSQHNPLSSPWNGEDGPAREQRDMVSPSAQPASRHGSRSRDPQQRQFSVETDKGRRSVSVSPRTVVANLGNSGDNVDHNDQTIQLLPKDMDDEALKGGNNNTNNSGARNFTGHHPHDAGGTIPSQYPPTTPQASQQPPFSRPSTISPPSKRSLRNEPPAPTGIHNHLSPTREDTRMASATPPPPLLPPPSSVPKRKRRRYDEPPIFARKAPRTFGSSPMIPAQRTPQRAPFRAAPVKSDAEAQAPPPRNKSLPPRPPLPSNTNGQPPANGTMLLSEQVQSSLGPWEPSITGIIPHEEVTKLICDFLFQQVVMRKDLGAGPAGGSATGQGAILEVEAKLGQIVDKNRGERLRLPVLTECVLSRDDPGIRTAFESSMSLAQHRAMNNFLNESVKGSMTPPRMPVTYAHKKERDTFYEISASALPPVIQHHLHPRHKPKVRVTTDQRTGAILAQIVKCRIADLEVYSPRTCLDWRISVNLEMNFEGDISGLSPVGDMGQGKRGGNRIKDRMSYRHLAYQIDLTQVTTEVCGDNPEPDHELEIEISSAEVRRQGNLALAGDPSNRYEELIKGFIDNVRVLARMVPN